MKGHHSYLKGRKNGLDTKIYLSVPKALSYHSFNAIEKNNKGNYLVQQPHFIGQWINRGKKNAHKDKTIKTLTEYARNGLKQLLSKLL